MSLCIYLLYIAHISIIQTCTLYYFIHCYTGFVFWHSFNNVLKTYFDIFITTVIVCGLTNTNSQEPAHTLTQNRPITKKSVEINASNRNQVFYLKKYKIIIIISCYCTIIFSNSLTI